jgi:hypothetical protein
MIELSEVEVESHRVERNECQIIKVSNFSKFYSYLRNITLFLIGFCLGFKLTSLLFNSIWSK